MNEKLVALKAALAALFSGLAAFLGWKGIVAVTWIVLMALDYISGTAAACKAGKWSSKMARDGIWHKCGMILVVIAAAIADGVLTLLFANIPGTGLSWPGMVLPLVLAWYIITELGSILENAILLGAAVPSWLTKMLQVAQKAVDTAGGADAGENPPEDLTPDP